MASRKQAPAAVAVAKQLKAVESEEPIRLSTGFYAKIRPVSASLIDGAQARIKDPDPPTVYIDEKDRHEPNPNDPAYLRELDRLQVERAMAAADAMILFGVELVNEDGEPLPVKEMLDGVWIKKLKLLERHGTIDLSLFDMDDEIDVDFLFKKYIAVGAPDLVILSMASGVREEDVKRAADTFRGN